MNMNFVYSKKIRGAPERKRLYFSYDVLSD